MTTQATLLKIYVGEGVQSEGKPLYQALLYELKNAGLAGVTVLRGIEGYGELHKVHMARLLELSADLPMVVECIDSTDKINAIIPVIKEMVPRGVILTADVQIHKWHLDETLTSIPLEASIQNSQLQ